MIVIIGDRQDVRTAAVVERLEERQHPYFLFETRRYPKKLQLTQSIDIPSEGSLKNLNPSLQCKVKDIQSVYYCYKTGYSLCPEDPPEIQEVVYANIDSALWSFFYSLDCLIVNPFHPANLHNYKTHLLKAFRAAGIRVPNTVVTNDPEAVVEFYQAHRDGAVFKPPWGQSFTEKLTDAHLSGNTLSKLENSPIMLQEYIEGQEMRIYVIGNETFGVRVESEAVDINKDSYARRVPIEITEEMSNTARKMTEVAGLYFSAIDLRMTPSGECVYFEANSSPDFTTDEAWTGYPLSDRLVDLLIKGRVD